MAKAKNAGSKQKHSQKKAKRKRASLTGRDLSTLPDFTPLRKSEVLILLPISRAGWDAGVKAGKYPTPHYLSPHIPTWTLGTIKQLALGSAS